MTFSGYRNGIFIIGTDTFFEGSKRFIKVAFHDITLSEIIQLLGIGLDGFFKCRHHL